ncbi:MAG: ATPase [Firmicutes bacterium HGW-Firmicutes-11]|jgi:pilus assembly protein CpaF|nr:MAG: ATPase [Firmicutes bacterium HGW-Firmicutes-11]
MEEFYLDTYLEEQSKRTQGSKWKFDELCAYIETCFLKEWETEQGDLSDVLRIQKNAIIGYKDEIGYFKEKIAAKLRDLDALATGFPAWYESLEDGIYHENWGLAGIAQWFSPEYGNSSSAKIIGERIYFLLNGRMTRMPQIIKTERREQLVRALLLLTPEERMDNEFHELYRIDGTRVTVFRERMTKKEQDVIVFRRYVIPTYSFQEQAARGTIPYDSIPLLEAMVDTGYNVAFTGAVRTAKTTFLSTWQSREDPMLEGVMVETDPEIPLHRIMPDAPILQLIADNERLGKITKNLLRSDADYFIMAEARDGNALDTAIRIASKGTRRMKITFHCRDPFEFPYDVAWEIVNAKGGDIHFAASRVAGSFDYLLHFIQQKDKSKKRLYGIYEIGLTHPLREIRIRQICKYDTSADRWYWINSIDQQKKRTGIEENPDGYQRFSEELDRLSLAHPMPDEFREDGKGNRCLS